MKEVLETVACAGGLVLLLQSSVLAPEVISLQDVTRDGSPDYLVRTTVRPGMDLKELVLSGEHSYKSVLAQGTEDFQYFKIDENIFTLQRDGVIYKL